MSDDLFTDEPPTEPGWYWVRSFMAWAGTKAFPAKVSTESVCLGGRCYTSEKFQYGPRIPTPEQCAAMAKE